MKLFTLFITIFFFSGCASTSASKFAMLSPGMSKEEVVQKLGSPYLFRGATQTRDSTQEVWEYTVYAPYQKNANFWTGNITFLTVFLDGKLIQWGYPQDFGMTVRQPDLITEHTIKER